MELGLLLIFWYGVLHAFAPDHLMVIADFSIGKSKRKTFLITLSFAIGHGVMLLIFAKLLQHYNISDTLLQYADIISASVIIVLGFYLLYMVLENKIHLNIHTHDDNKEHIHIWFGDKHKHNNQDSATALTLGLLMGLGGVRGMLVTLGVIQSNSVDFTLVLFFVLGVSFVFILFGLVILYINKKILHNIQNIKRSFATVGVLSVIIGFNMLFIEHSHAVMFTPDISNEQNHTHQTTNDMDKLINSKEKSDMSYKQMMQNLGESYSMIQRGVLYQNKELIKIGSLMINNHPVPNHKPWSIVRKEDQEDFKSTLLSYDQLLHDGTQNIIISLEKDDWIDINSKVYQLSKHCVSCHSIWKQKVINNKKG